MEIEKLPSFALTIMELLDLDDRAQEYIFEQVKIARAKFKEQRQTIHTCMSVDEARDTKGMYIVLAVGDKTMRKDCLEGTIILGSMIKRKNPNCEVIGILNDIEDKEDKIVTCLKLMKPKPGFDKALEKVKEFKDWYMKV